MSGGDEAVCGRRSWLAATGSSSPCWLFQNSRSDFSTWRQYSIAPRLSKAVAVAFEISEDDWKKKERRGRNWNEGFSLRDSALIELINGSVLKTVELKDCVPQMRTWNRTWFET